MNKGDDINPATGLQAQHAIRFAAIMDKQPHRFAEYVHMKSFGALLDDHLSDPTWSGQERQAQKEDGTGFSAPPLPWFGRGMVLGTEFVGHYMYYNYQDHETIRKRPPLPAGPLGIRPDRADFVILNYEYPTCLSL